MNDLWDERDEREPYRKHVMFPVGSNPTEWDRLEREGWREGL